MPPSQTPDMPEAAQRVPAHVGIIMDGNGRWAQARGLPRFMGHRHGVEALRITVRTAADLGVEHLTVFAFSSENWKRPAAEVDELLGLLRRFLRRDLAELHANGVCVRAIGERRSLSTDLASMIAEAEALTRNNRDLILTIAFNYGGRDEIARAVRAIAHDVAAGRLLPEEIDEKVISSKLDTANVADPDLIIRTSGEQRLSNFLLWQAAYSEFVFLDCYWPDFGRDQLIEAISVYQARERRYGAVGRAKRASAAAEAS